MRSAVLLLSLLALGAGGCSIKKMAMKSVAGSLAEGGGSFARDDDPDLVQEAVPFSLKLMETLLEELPDHVPLLTAACRSFTQYAYAYLQNEADYVEEENYARAKHLRARAVKLYRRGRDYGLRALEAERKGFREALRKEPDRALERFEKKHVEALYWTGASWMALIALSKDDPAALGEFSTAEALVRRAFTLNPDWREGTLHEFFMVFEASRPAAMGGSVERAKEHFRRAVELTGGKKASLYVGYAEAVSVPAQNREEFRTLLQTALSVDVEERPEWRLENLVAQKRAQWLLSREETLFLE